MEEHKNRNVDTIKVKREESEEKSKKVFDIQYNIILNKYDYDIYPLQNLLLF